MQAPAHDTKTASRAARMAWRKQPVVALRTGLPNLSLGNKRINFPRTWILTTRQRNRVAREDQNEPPYDIAFGARGDAVVLERNIVNRSRRAANFSSDTASRSAAKRNRAQEQSLVARWRAPFGDCDGAAESFRFVATKTGTNGEEDMAVKLYARPGTILKRNTDGHATFTECYAVLEKIMDSTPGKGDGS